VVADFGLARVSPTDPDRVRPGAGTGTHLEPEQWRNEEPCAESDVYSFGVFVWEVVTRRQPWRGLDLRQIRDALARGERLLIPADAAPSLAEVMRRCFEPRAVRPSMQEVSEMLTSLSARSDVDAPPVEQGASTDIDSEGAAVDSLAFDGAQAHRRRGLSRSVSGNLGDDDVV
jgi:serine/threonine protein kinase